MKKIITLFLVLCLSLVGYSADEIRVDYPSGETLYSTVREFDGDVWYPTTNVFEVWGTSGRDASDYDIAMVDKSGDYYVGQFDADISAGRYRVQTWLQDGGSPDESADSSVRIVVITWNGTAEEFTIDTSGQVDSELTGDSFAIVDHADYGNDQLVRSTTPANTLDITDGLAHSSTQTMASNVISKTTITTELRGILGQYNLYQARVVSGTDTIFTLESADASAVDDIYNNKYITVYVDTEPEDSKYCGIVKDYVGSTRQITLYSALPVTPDNTYFVDIARNEIHASMLAISLDELAAGNLKDMFNGTGYTDENAPSTQAQVGNLSTGSAAISTVVTSTEDTTPAVVGTPTNTYTATVQENGVYHSWVPDGGTLEFAYNFNIGPNASPVEAIWVGYCQSINDEIGVYARNWAGASWEQVGTIDGTVGVTDQAASFILTTSHVNTGANSGDARIRFYSTGGAVITTFATDRMLMSYTITNQSVGYSEGAIWFDDTAANTNTVAYVDGVADNPVSSWAAVKTLISSVGITKVHIANGSTVTLDANSDNYSLYGIHWSLALGGQSINSAAFTGADVSGTGTTTSESPHFEGCTILSPTLPPCDLHGCYFGGDIILGAGDYFFDRCASAIAGTSTPSIDFGEGAVDTNLSLRHYSGGIEIKNMGDAGTDNMSLEGDGQLVINANCDGGTVAIRGSYTVTDNAGGNVTLSDDARYDVGQIDVTITANSVVTDIPNTAEFEARTILAENYFDPDADDVANVTLVVTTTTNSDMRGTDSANTTVPDVAGTAAGLHGTTDALITTMDTAVDTIAIDVAGLDGDAMRGTDSAATEAKQDTMQTAVDDIPNTAEFEARTILSASYFDFTSDQVFMGGILTTVFPGEVVSGSLANNYHQFYDLTPTSSKTLNDVGSGGGGDATEAKQDLILEDLVDIKGTGFVKDTHSLVNIHALALEAMDWLEADQKIDDTNPAQFTIVRTKKQSGGGGAAINTKNVNDISGNPIIDLNTVFAEQVEP